MHRRVVGRRLQDAAYSKELGEDRILVEALDAAFVTQVEASWSHCGQQTRRHLGQHLRWFLRALREQGAPDLQQFVRIIPREQARIVTPTQQEISRLVATPDMALRWVILCGAEAALRFDTAIRVRPCDCAAGTVSMVSKLGNIVSVPMSPALQAMLAVLPHGSNPLEPIVNLLEGRKLTAWNTTLHNRFKRWKQRQGVRAELRFHDLRRGLAVRLYRTTGSLRTVQKLLSHTNLTSTLHYLNAASSEFSLTALNAAIAEKD